MSELSKSDSDNLVALHNWINNACSKGAVPVVTGLNEYANNVELNKFGGRFKYSKVSTLIDRIDNGITSNITKVIIRRDLKALLNQFAQYELCFGNRFNINPAGYNIKSTGFTISGFSDTAYITDVPIKIYQAI